MSEDKNVQSTDYTLKSFDLLSAQRSFHEKLIQCTNIRGMDLITLLNVHARFLTECFKEIKSQGSHDLYLGDNLEGHRLEYVKSKIAHDFSKLILERVKIDIEKTPQEIRWESSCLVMLSEIKPYQPIKMVMRRDIEI